jgi:hypothetical protein
MSTPAGSFASLDQLPADQSAAAPTDSSYYSAGLAPQVTFKETDTTPPSIVYVARDDRLRATVYTQHGTSQITGGARLLKADGSIQIYALNIPGINGQSGAFTSSFDFDLSEGFLLDVAFLAPGTISLGDIFLSLGLIRGTGSSALWVQTLVQDYLVGDQAVGWPGSGIKNSVEGDGGVVTQVYTNPLAGSAFFDMAMPNGVEWEPVLASCGFTTSAAVGNRNLQVQLRKVLGQPYLMAFQVTQVASQGNFYMVGKGLTAIQDSFNNHTLPLPTGYRMRGGGFDSIRFIVLGVDAADQFSSGIVETRQWLRP